MKFYNNKKNEPLKFKLNVEGIDTNNIETRLILKSNKSNYLFFGTIKEDVCIFDIPELNLYEKENIGLAKFEIISEDLYFPVWEDNFEIKTKASITFEQLVTETKKTPSKPKISASAILNAPIEKDIKPIIKEKKDTKKEIKIDKNKEIKNFDSFFNK